MPYEPPARLQNSGEFPNHPGVIRGMREEAERREKVEHSVETARPLGGHAPHVSARVAKSVAGSALPRDVQKLLRIVEPVDIVAELCQQVRVAALSARNIEHAGAHRKTKQLDQARNFLSVALGREE